MLRELVWKLLSVPQHIVDNCAKGGYIFHPPTGCYFCGKPLLVRPDDMTFGHKRHPRVNTDITIHHIDEDRTNNDPSNLAECHDSCHRSHHAKKRAAYRKEVVRRYEETHQEKENQEERILISDEKGDPE